MKTYQELDTGWYQIASTVATYGPTGRMVLGENYSRQFYQFWKPKLILKPEMEQTGECTIRQMAFIKQGEFIASVFPAERVRS